jgi:hypothetical protein
MAVQEVSKEWRGNPSDLDRVSQYMVSLRKHKASLSRHHSMIVTELSECEGKGRRSRNVPQSYYS